MSSDAFTHQAIVIGSGVAGLAAAKALATAGLTTALVDDGMLGGLILNVGEVEGASPLAGQSGADAVNLMLGEALEAGVDYQMGAVESLAPVDGGWRLPELEISAAKVVLATGAKLRKLGAPGEERLTGRGVSQCAFCDGGLYRGQNVVVVGGGDGAFQEALHLARMCARVDMLVRGPAPRARQAYLDAAAAAANLHVRTGVEVKEIVGEDGVDAIRIADAAAGAEETLATRAVFVFIGVVPETALAPPEAARDPAGALIVDASFQTDRPGLHAIGAARAGYDGQLATALADANALA